MVNNQLANIDQLVRITLVAALVYWSSKLILPLFGVLTWGFILAVALYPIYAWLKDRLKGQKIVAALIITLLSLLLVVGSLVLLTNNMLSTISDVTHDFRAAELSFPPPPDFIKGWPVIGDQLHHTWSLASSNMGSTVNKYAGYLLEAGKYLLGKTANITFDLMLFIIAVLFSGYLLVKSDYLVTNIGMIAKRLAPERGLMLANIMKDTIQNVSRGVIGLSLFQALLLGLLLLIAGVPAAGLISFIALIMGIAQISLMLAVLPVIIWLFFTKSILFASLLTVPLCVVAALDNFVKPFILARGLSTPMLVIFVGVIGGVLTHGVIGIFIGPVILAIFYDLVNHWLHQ